MKKLLIVAALILAGCAPKPQPAQPLAVLPTLPAKVAPVKVQWKVIAEVKEIDGKQYLVIPFTGNPYVALTYSDSLIFRSWLNDVKRKNDQTDNVFCALGYKEVCPVIEKTK